MSFPCMRPAIWCYTLLISALLLGCSSVKVTRIDPNEEIALSDKWNAKDSQLVAETLIDDMLTFPWYEQFLRSHPAQTPAVIVQTIRNHSHEHIEVDTFINDLKRAMLRSGRVDFVASGAARDDLRDERADQATQSSADTAKPRYQERGADYAINGVINSYVDRYKDQRVTFYQVDITLVDLRDNREVWLGQKKIQKLQEK